MGNIVKVTGRVVSVGEKKTFANSDFAIREVVVDIGTAAWPSPVPFTFKKKYIDLGEGLKEGDIVTIGYALGGRAWVRDGVTRYFTEVAAITCERQGGAGATGADKAAAIDAYKAAHGCEFDKDDFISLCKATNGEKKSTEYTSADWQRVVEAVKNPPVSESVEADDIPF